MWGWDYGTISGGCWGGSFPGSIMFLLILAFVIIFVMYLAIRIYKSHTYGLQGSFKDRLDSEAILKVRFARGEITREEFIKMRQILSQP
jgi:putative membrane protein